MCHRPLRDPESIAAGVGPVCRGESGTGSMCGFGRGSVVSGGQMSLEWETEQMGVVLKEPLVVRIVEHLIVAGHFDAADEVERAFGPIGERG